MYISPFQQGQLENSIEKLTSHVLEGTELVSVYVAHCLPLRIFTTILLVPLQLKTMSQKLSRRSREAPPDMEARIRKAFDSAATKIISCPVSLYAVLLPYSGCNHRYIKKKINCKV